MNSVLYLIIACGVLSIVYAIWAIQSVMAADAGNKRMQEIAGHIREGAMAYLSRQYMTIAVVGVVVFVIAWLLLSAQAAMGFAIGAILSGAAGFIGMLVSVRANVRTAQAASKSLGAGLEIAFKSGAITGLLVAGLALLGVAVYYWALTGPLGESPESRTVPRQNGNIGQTPDSCLKTAGPDRIERRTTRKSRIRQGWRWPNPIKLQPGTLYGGPRGA